MGKFSAGPINKAVQSFRIRFTRVREGNGRHSEHFSLLKKVFTLNGVCTVLSS